MSNVVALLAVANKSVPDKDITDGQPQGNFHKTPKVLLDASILDGACTTNNQSIHQREIISQLGIRQGRPLVWQRGSAVKQPGSLTADFVHTRTVIYLCGNQNLPY